MKKSWFAAFVAIIIVAVGLYFLRPAYFFEKPGASNAALRTVTLNQAIEHLLYIALYVAKDKGFFAEQGLDLKIATGGGDAQAFSALTSGSAEFAQGDPAFVAIAAEKGWEGRVVAMAVDRVAIWGVTFDPSIKPFTDPIRFKGLKIATYPEPNTSFVVQKELALRAGLTPGKDLQIIQVPFGTELATLKDGRADIAQTIEPNASSVALSGGSVVFSYPDAWGPLAFTGVMTSKKLIEEQPKVVQGFVNAYERALQYIATDFEGALEVAIKRFQTVDPKVVESGLRRLTTSKSIPRHARVNENSWQNCLQIRVDVGDLKQMPSQSLVDNSFAEKAAKPPYLR